jgi:hypothetical protein
MLPELSVLSSGFGFSNTNYNYDNTNSNVSSHLSNLMQHRPCPHGKKSRKKARALVPGKGERDLLKAKAI